MSKSKPIFINHKKIDNFVERQAKKGNLISWDGWNVVVFREDKRAWSSPSGVFDRNTRQWGFTNVIAPTRKGFYVFKDYMLK